MTHLLWPLPFVYIEHSSQPLLCPLCSPSGNSVPYQESNSNCFTSSLKILHAFDLKQKGLPSLLSPSCPEQLAAARYSKFCPLCWCMLPGLPPPHNSCSTVHWVVQSPSCSVMTSPWCMLALYSRSQLCPLSSLKALWISLVSDRLQIDCRLLLGSKAGLHQMLETTGSLLLQERAAKTWESFLLPSRWGARRAEHMPSRDPELCLADEWKDFPDNCLAAWAIHHLSTYCGHSTHRLDAVELAAQIIWFCSCRSPFEG